MKTSFSIYYLGITKLKEQDRQGWNYGQSKVAKPESAAAHSWGLIRLIMLYARQQGYDERRILRMIELAAIHDQPEAIVGDKVSYLLTPEQKITKRQTEEEALYKQCDLIGDPHLSRVDRSLWFEYADKTSIEAIEVGELDKLEAVYQGITYTLNDPDCNIRPWFWLQEYEPQITLNGTQSLVRELWIILIEKFHRQMLMDKQFMDGITPESLCPLAHSTSS